MPLELVGKSCLAGDKRGTKFQLTCLAPGGTATGAASQSQQTPFTAGPARPKTADRSENACEYLTHPTATLCWAQACVSNRASQRPTGCSWVVSGLCPWCPCCRCAHQCHSALHCCTGNASLGLPGCGPKACWQLPPIFSPGEPLFTRVGLPPTLQGRCHEWASQLVFHGCSSPLVASDTGRRWVSVAGPPRSWVAPRPAR